MAQEVKVVRASNENQVLFKGTEDDARDYVERNFPRHHVDPAAPVQEEVEPDVYLVGAGGQKEYYVGEESADPWQKVQAKSSGGKQ